MTPGCVKTLRGITAHISDIGSPPKSGVNRRSKPLPLRLFKRLGYSLIQAPGLGADMRRRDFPSLIGERFRFKRET